MRIRTPKGARSAAAALLTVFMMPATWGFAQVARETRPVPPVPAVENTAPAQQATGRVASVSENKKTFVVNVDGKKMTFWVAEGAARDIENLQRGDRVTVRYTDQFGQLTAQQVIKG